MSILYWLHIIGWNPFFVCKLHYFSTLTYHIQCSYPQLPWEWKQRIRQGKIKKKIYKETLYTTQERSLFPVSEITCEPQCCCRQSPQNLYYRIHDFIKPRSDPEKQQFNYLISHLQIAFSRLPAWSAAWGCFFFPSPLCAVELDFYFPAAYIPWRKRKPIHEVPICIKYRNICHRILVGGLKHQEIVPLIICLNTIEFCFCQRELWARVFEEAEKREFAQRKHSYYYSKRVIGYVTPSHTNTQEWALPRISTCPVPSDSRFFCKYRSYKGMWWFNQHPVVVYNTQQHFFVKPHAMNDPRSRDNIRKCSLYSAGLSFGFGLENQIKNLEEKLSVSQIRKNFILFLCVYIIHDYNHKYQVKQTVHSYRTHK